MADAGFEHFDASAAEALGKFLLENVLNSLFATSQGQGFFVVIVESVVRELTRKVANCRLCLDFNESAIVFNIKQGFVSVLNLPDDNHANLNWVSALVIHVFWPDIVVLSLHRDGNLRVAGVRPEKTVVFDCSLVLTKEHHHTSFVRVDCEHSFNCDASGTEKDWNATDPHEHRLHSDGNWNSHRCTAKKQQDSRDATPGS